MSATRACHDHARATSPTSGQQPLERSPIAMPRGIIVDVPDVLYDATPWRRWLVQLINRLGVAADYGTFYQDWDRRYLPDVNRGKRDFDEALQSFLLSQGLSWGQIDELEAASHIQRKKLDLPARALPGVTSTLARISGLGIPLVAWADVPYAAAALVECLDKIGIARHFEAVCSSLDLGEVQPAPGCYTAALAALGLGVEGVIYLGHDDAHLTGAKNAGLMTVAFNFGASAAADCYLTRFEDLFRVISAALPQRTSGHLGDTLSTAGTTSRLGA